MEETNLPVTDIEDILQEYVDDYNLMFLMSGTQPDVHWTHVKNDGLYYKVKMEQSNYVEIQIILVGSKNLQQYNEMLNSMREDFETRLNDKSLKVDSFNYKDSERHYGSDNQLLRILVINKK
jgi:transcriptional regulator of aromatic amino acid metabolism